VTGITRDCLVGDAVARRLALDERDRLGMRDGVSPGLARAVSVSACYSSPDGG
jgi:hypothetical protein